MPYRYAAIDANNVCRGVADFGTPYTPSESELGVYPQYHGQVMIVPCDKSARVGATLTPAQIFAVPTAWN